MIPPPDDYRPDTQPPINRARCLALKWFDDDPMPAVCRLQPEHEGGHVAMTTARTVAQAWDSDEACREAAGEPARGRVDPEDYSHVVRPKWNDPTEGAA